MAKLTAVQVKNAKPGRHADGKGLYLLVKPSGAKSWVLRVQVSGRRRDFGLGSTDIVTLQEAREKAQACRKMAKEGLDPVLERKKANRLIPTFREAAERYHAAVKGGWRNGKHTDQWPLNGVQTVSSVQRRWQALTAIRHPGLAVAVFEGSLCLPAARDRRLFPQSPEASR